MDSVHLVYGDFSCPFSYLASTWCEELTGSGALEVEWRAVEQDPAIPRRGRRLDAARASALAEQLDVAAARFGTSDRCRVTVPRVLPNSSLATGVFAGQHGARARRLRHSLFVALWRDGLNLGRWEQLDRVLQTPLRADFTRAARWRRSWCAYDRPQLPAVVLPTGAVLEQRRAMEYLAGRVTQTFTPNTEMRR